jgi:ribose 5-phosphate isomerase B
MRIIVGCDDARPVVEHIAAHLRQHGHEVDAVLVKPWGEVALDVGRAVATGKVDQGIALCWTGTGVAMAANKVAGVRAALCTDAATAAGARQWNDANVLALSLRLLSEPLATEILDAWLRTRYEGTERESLDLLREEESRR